MKNKTMNLCNSCKNEFATCNVESIEFGNGKGNDNVIKCDLYNSREYDMAGICPNCMSRVFVDMICGEFQCCRCGEVYHK